MYTVNDNTRIPTDTAPGRDAGARARGPAPGRRPHSGGRYEGRRGRTGFYRALEAENCREEEDEFFRFGKPRARLLTTAQCFHDYEWFEDRARHSTGWKEHRDRHQWGHGARGREKHAKNRARKALRRGGYPADPAGEPAGEETRETG